MLVVSLILSAGLVAIDATAGATAPAVEIAQAPWTSQAFDAAVPTPMDDVPWLLPAIAPEDEEEDDLDSWAAPAATDAIRRSIGSDPVGRLIPSTTRAGSTVRSVLRC